MKLKTNLQLWAAGLIALSLSACSEVDEIDEVEQQEEEPVATREVPAEAIDGYFVREGEPLLGPPEETVIYESEDYADTPEEERKTIVFFTDDGGHGWMQHENTAGSILLAKRLAYALPGVRCIVLRDIFPDAEMLAEADSLVLFSNGHEGHPTMVFPEASELLENALEDGIGLVGIHWALEPGDDAGADLLNRAFGGHFKLDYSVNPMWLAEFKEIPAHPVNNGVEPYTIYEEYYFNIYFVDEGGERTDTLTAIPPDLVTKIPKDGPRSNNPHVRESAGQPHVIAWTWDRDDGGRSFGFNGGHFHWAWKHDDYRLGMLNAIAWTAGIDVPENGIDSPTPSDTELFLYQSDPKQADWRPHPQQPPMDSDD